MTAPGSIVWFRIDLRLTDHPALHAARQRPGPVIPVFIHAPEEESPWEPGGASRWWLHQSLESLQRDLQQAGSRLVIRRGPTLEALRDLARETGAGAVFWNRRYEPVLAARDHRITSGLRAEGLTVESFNGALLREPWTIANRSGGPFQVFTPFWRHCLEQPAPAEPLAAPRVLPGLPQWPRSLELGALGLEPRVAWADGLRAAWQPGVRGARSQLKRFLEHALPDYDENRNRPDLAGTSRLSPHLHFGEITPREIWQAVRRRAEACGIPEARWRGGQFLTELGWREFAHHLLHHFPRTPEQPLRADFARFRWRKDRAGLKAWQRGATGYPIVDAGMRELWTTGWMHNRVRMVVASFLVKDLLHSWQEGARWFWDTLVDADLAQNTLGWQWSAGCGADAAPYFRIFNPVSQGERFDPHGTYVRRWCPELAKLPDAWLHRPWEAPGDLRLRAGLDPGDAYPAPVVSHAIAREVALEAFRSLKTGAPPP